MGFNTVIGNGSNDKVSTAILNQIHVDGVFVKTVPYTQSPNVVYRVGDGTVHSEGWDNVLDNEYLDFYLPQGYSVGEDGSVVALNNEFIVAGLPSTADEGNLAVNVLDGGVYEWRSGAWVLIAQSSGGASASTTPVIPIVDGLPSTADEGTLVFNTIDTTSYAYINGVWTELVGLPSGIPVGIEVVGTLPATPYEDQTVFLTTDNKLWRYTTAGGWAEVISPTGVATEVADGSITTAKLASGLTPVEILDVLPTTLNYDGRMVYLTTDKKLYRYDATLAAFTSAVPTTDLTGAITETQIGANSVSTGKLAVGAVTADTIAANAVTAGKIAALAVTAGTIQAGAVGASEIAAGAILVDKLAAGSVTATKIAASAITAEKIATDAITSDKILANSIIAGKIAVGAVSANQIVANAVTSDKIAAGSVTATKIAAYSITADKLTVDSLSTAKFYCTDGNALAYSVYLAYVETTAHTVALGGVKKGTTYGNGLYGANYSTALQSAGVRGANASTTLGYGVQGSTTAGAAINSAGVYGTCNSAGSFGVFGKSLVYGGIGVRGDSPTWGIYGYTTEAYGQWGVITDQKMYSAGGYSPFTGSHLVFSKDVITQGDTVKVISALGVSVNQAYMSVVASCTAMDKTAIGVVDVGHKNIFDILKSDKDIYNREDIYEKSTGVTEQGAFSEEILVDTIYTVKPEYKIYVDTLINEGYFVYEINALGEGMINVCSENGNIEIGDYICSSNVRGKGMKQDDDLLHNYTVAKALESVDWSNETSTTKMISCTYHCG